MRGIHHTIFLEEIVYPLVGLAFVLVVFGGIVWFMSGGVK
jgi:hypothetical protein